MSEDDDNERFKIGQIVESFNKVLLKPNFYLDENIQMYLQNAEKVSNEVKSNKANIIINVLHKQKSEKQEQRASIWKHTQPSEDRINSDSQNKKVTNKYMN